MSIENSWLEEEKTKEAIPNKGYRDCHGLDSVTCQRVCDSEMQEGENIANGYRWSIQDEDAEGRRFDIEYYQILKPYVPKDWIKREVDDLPPTESEYKDAAFQLLCTDDSVEVRMARFINWERVTGYRLLGDDDFSDWLPNDGTRPVELFTSAEIVQVYAPAEDKGAQFFISRAKKFTWVGPKEGVITIEKYRYFIDRAGNSPEIN